ncbi:MAG: DUF4469 domain-containing protein [Treponemataceae bacterium]|nr:DUF4469 domain-containing protein [Treponemataceae bacterium]
MVSITEKSETKAGNLPVVLYPNKMRQDTDGKLTYYAKTINRGVCTNADLADDVIASDQNDGLSKEQIQRIAKRLNEAKMQRVSDGYTVDDGINRFCARVKGTFDSDSDTFSTDRHAIGLSVHPSAAANERLSSLRPVIRQGNEIKPVVTDVFDLESKGNAVLTRGGFLNISGTNIRIGGDSEEVGLYFMHSQDGTKDVKLSAEKLGINTQTRLACVIPSGLEAGTYRLKVVTQALSSKAYRKKPTAFTFQTELTAV